MFVREFCEWLAAMPASIALHESHYVFLIVLTAHVMSLCVFVGLAVIVDLRLLGLTLTRVPASELVSRLIPWTASGFVVTVTSGSLLFYAAPIDRYENIFFRAKMALLVIAGVNVWIFHQGVYRRVMSWDLDPVPPWAARAAGGFSLLFWGAMILAGRMIPYQRYWFG